MKKIENNKLLAEWKAFLAENCFNEKKYGDGEYDIIMMEWWLQKTNYPSCANCGHDMYSIEF